MSIKAWRYFTPQSDFRITQTFFPLLLQHARQTTQLIIAARCVSVVDIITSMRCLPIAENRIISINLFSYCLGPHIYYNINNTEVVRYDCQLHDLPSVLKQQRKVSRRSS